MFIKYMEAKIDKILKTSKTEKKLEELDIREELEEIGEKKEVLLGEEKEEDNDRSK